MAKSKVVQTAANIGKGAAVAAGVAGAAYVGGSAYVAKKSRDVMHNGMDRVADDLTHVLTHGMSANPLEEQLSLRGHENCAATYHPHRPLPNIDYGSGGHGHEGPEY